MSSSDNSRAIWDEAQRIAKSGKNPHEIWTELKQWAYSVDDPLAMKAAVFTFLSKQGTNSEAAPLLIEVMRDASHISPTLPEDERKRLSELADRSITALKSSYVKPSLVDVKELSTDLPVSGNRPAISFSINPKQEKKDLGIYAPITPSRDDEHLLKARDTMLNINEKVLNMNMPSKDSSTGEDEKEEKYEQLSSSEVQSFSLPFDSTPRKADKGEILIQSLVDKLKSHSPAKATSKVRLLTPQTSKSKKSKKKKRPVKKVSVKKKSTKKIKKKPKKAAKKPKKKTAKKKPVKKAKKTLKKKKITKKARPKKKAMKKKRRKKR